MYSNISRNAASWKISTIGVDRMVSFYGQVAELVTPLILLEKYMFESYSGCKADFSIVLSSISVYPEYKRVLLVSEE
jgi:hypothetical protein